MGEHRTQAAEKIEHRKAFGENITGSLSADYTEEELKFMEAIEDYKRRHHRPFPTWEEVLKIIKVLGYVKKPGENGEPVQIPETAVFVPQRTRGAYQRK